MDKKEKELEEKCVMFARQKGIASLKLERNGNTGVPDRLFIFKGGYTFFTEFKKPKKTTSNKKSIEKSVNFDAGGGVLSTCQKIWGEFLGPYHFCVVSDFQQFTAILSDKENTIKKNSIEIVEK